MPREGSFGERRWRNVVSMLRSIADELVSLFVDDGSLVVLVLIWLTVCWLLPKLSLPSPLLPVLLFVGLVAILAESAIRRADER